MLCDQEISLSRPLLSALVQVLGNVRVFRDSAVLCRKDDMYFLYNSKRGNALPVPNAEELLKLEQRLGEALNYVPREFLLYLVKVVVDELSFALSQYGDMLVLYLPVNYITIVATKLPSDVYTDLNDEFTSQIFQTVLECRDGFRNCEEVMLNLGSAKVKGVKCSLPLLMQKSLVRITTEGMAIYTIKVDSKSEEPYSRIIVDSYADLGDVVVLDSISKKLYLEHTPTQPIKCILELSKIILSLRRRNPTQEDYKYARELISTVESRREGNFYAVRNGFSSYLELFL